jgi:CHAT domain-containing protein
MEQFYAALAAGRPAGSALRAARLAAMRRGQAASVWGAFSVVGDATVIASGR